MKNAQAGHSAPQTFEQAAEHLIKWLAENEHPHTMAVVTSTSAQLFDGKRVHNTNEFLCD
ncbi:hypothetical protein [Kluyvera georgiana]|uniref:hypothetical protein n=1 Tax=Kluyvera georgiana TaxID=73098 RepID=UPI003AEF9B86